MNISTLKPEKWGLIFILLSMDIMMSLYEDMGLKIIEKQAFKRKLRQLIITNRKIYEKNPSVIPNIAKRVVEEVKLSFGIKQMEHFYQWATTVFTEVHTDQPYWSAWEILFFHWVHNPKYRNRLDLTIDKSNLILNSYANLLDVTKIEHKVSQLKLDILSDWDLEMYSIHQFNHDDELNNPFSTVTMTIQINQFQIFFQAILPELTVTTKEMLWEEGMEIINELGIWMPATLKQPDKMLRAI